MYYKARTKGDDSSGTTSRKTLTDSQTGGSPTSVSNANALEPISLQDYNELEEMARLRLIVLKKEETELLAELDQLAIDRDLHIREVRRIRDEDLVI